MCQDFSAWQKLLGKEICYHLLAHISFFLFVYFSGDAQTERERSILIKAEIKEELSKLQDEITSCK